MSVPQGPWASGSSNWDPQNISAGFKYDPKNYNPADYARFKEARQARDKESLSKANALTTKLNKQLAKTVSDIVAEKSAPTEDEIQQAVRDGAVLNFNGGSTCFDSLSWQSDDGTEDNGTVSAVFQNGYAYDAQLDLETFLQWTEGSAGKFFNEVMGQDFFAPKAKGK